MWGQSEESKNVFNSISRVWFSLFRLTFCINLENMIRCVKKRQDMRQQESKQKWNLSVKWTMENVSVLDFVEYFKRFSIWVWLRNYQEKTSWWGLHRQILYIACMFLRACSAAPLCNFLYLPVIKSLECAKEAFAGPPRSWEKGLNRNAACWTLAWQIGAPFVTFLNLKM